MPLIQSKGVTARFTNRTGIAAAQKKTIDPVTGLPKDPMSVAGELRMLHQVLSARAAQYKSLTAPNEMVFDLKKDQTAQAPEWIVTDWNYHAHLLAAQKGGPGIIEIRPQQVGDLRASAAMIPAGTPPPEEASYYEGKTQITPSVALEGMEEPRKGSSTRASRS